MSRSNSESETESDTDSSSDEGVSIDVAAAKEFWRGWKGPKWDGTAYWHVIATQSTVPVLQDIVRTLKEADSNGAGALRVTGKKKMELIADLEKYYRDAGPAALANASREELRAFIGRHGKKPVPAASATLDRLISVATEAVFPEDEKEKKEKKTKEKEKKKEQEKEQEKKRKRTEELDEVDELIAERDRLKKKRKSALEKSDEEHVEAYGQAAASQRLVVDARRVAARKKIKGEYKDKIAVVNTKLRSLKEDLAGKRGKLRQDKEKHEKEKEKHEKKEAEAKEAVEKAQLELAQANASKKEAEEALEKTRKKITKLNQQIRRIPDA